MNRQLTKAEQRAQLARQVDDFLARGGSIQQCQMGETGLIDGNYNRNIIINGQQAMTRTPVPDVVAAIDARRKSGQRTATKPRRHTVPRQRKKVIYDDFGEPLRTIWVDEK